MRGNRRKIVGNFVKIATGMQFMSKMMRFRPVPRIRVLTLMTVSMASLGSVRAN